MSEREGSAPLRDLPALYEIRVQGEVAGSWSDQLHGLAIAVYEAPAGGRDTMLVGQLPDQRAVLDALAALCQHRLTLLSLRRMAPKDSQASVRERVTKTL